ncbi:hypothetical protein GCM10022376_06180 [Yimella lutea]
MATRPRRGRALHHKNTPIALPTIANPSAAPSGNNPAATHSNQPTNPAPSPTGAKAPDSHARNRSRSEDTGEYTTKREVPTP